MIYNVTNLFTNILLQEAIKIAINIIFNHIPNLKSLKKMKNLSFLLHHRLIFFNGKFYNQIVEVATGSYLAPVLANNFMSFKKSKILNEYNLN